MNGETLTQTVIEKLAKEAGGEEYGPRTWNISFKRDALHRFADLIANLCEEAWNRRTRGAMGGGAADISEAARRAADMVGVTPTSDMRLFVEQAVKYALTEDRAALGNTTGEEPGWQPIETAPKDGTHFLAYERNGAPDYYPCWFVSEQYEGAFWQNDYDSEPAPSHWQPLARPPLPETGEKVL